MPVIDDWTTHPLQILDNIFEKHKESAWEQEIENYFAAKLANIDAIKSIPSLNDVPVHDLKPNCLVRFRCMIQDMRDPEFFLGVYEVRDSSSENRSLRCGLYRDVADILFNLELDPDSPRNVTKDRLTYYCVSIPGENQWVKEGYKLQSKSRMAAAAASTSQTSARPKRPLENEQVEELGMDPLGNTVSPMDTEENGQPKRIRPDGAASNAGSPSYPELDLDTPLKDPNAIACLVKIYNHSESNSYQINDLVEFIGILSVDPTLAHFPQTGDEEEEVDSMGEDNQRSASSTAPSLLPRLHVIKGLKLIHNNPYLPLDRSCLVMDATKKQVLEEARGCLKHLLKNAFFQDSLVAEYVICHLVSSVYLRQDMVTLGKLCLNVSNVPANHRAFGTNFYRLIKNLTAQSHLLPLSIANATSLTFTPKKDYSANKLRSGVLQLPNRTHLIVDETALTVGRLDTNGVKNIKALEQVITSQKVSYDFNFHQIDFDANIVILVLSEGKSLLPADLQIPLIFDEKQLNFDELSDLTSTTTPQIINIIRNYLCEVPLMSFNIADDLQQTIEETFVEMRRNDAANVTVDDLHLLLVFARLLSLSYGRTTLDVEMWQKALNLESARKERMRHARPTPPSAAG